MAIDSIALLAQNSYTKIQDQPRFRVDDVERTEAIKFQSMVEKQFNSFAKMTPAQILSHIQSAKSVSSNTNINNSGVVFSAAKNIRETLQKQEHTVRKSLIGEASLIDVLTTTTEAKNVMDTTIRVRDKLLEAFDKVMNMAM